MYSLEDIFIKVDIKRYSEIIDISNSGTSGCAKL